MTKKLKIIKQLDIITKKKREKTTKCTKTKINTSALDNSDKSVEPSRYFLQRYSYLNNRLLVHSKFQKRFCIN